MINSACLGKRFLSYISVLSLLSLSGDFRRYDKCSISDGGEGVCVVKRYCRGAKVSALEPCEGVDTYCCPIPTTTRSASSVPRDQFPRNPINRGLPVHNISDKNIESPRLLHEGASTQSQEKHNENRRVPNDNRPLSNGDNDSRRNVNSNRPVIEPSNRPYDGRDRYSPARPETPSKSHDDRSKDHTYSRPSSGKEVNRHDNRPVHFPSPSYDDVETSYYQNDRSRKPAGSYGQSSEIPKNAAHNNPASEIRPTRPLPNTDGGLKNTRLNSGRHPEGSSSKPDRAESDYGSFSSIEKSRSSTAGNDRGGRPRGSSGNSHVPNDRGPLREESKNRKPAPVVIKFPDTYEASVASPQVPGEYKKLKNTVGKNSYSCGVKPYDLFIAGGEESEQHEWPWMTAIFRRQASRPKIFLCGGSLINTKYVLTAAHCFVNNYVILPASSFVVRLGSHHLDNGEEYTVANLIVHHNHSGSEFFNDIALVRLASEVYVTDKIAPICLPSPEMMTENLVGRFATVAGWGDIAFRTVGTRILQHVAVPIVTSEECFAAYSRVRGAAFLARGSDHVICAGLREGGKDACLGDSGGPLMLKTTDGRWAIVGIVSLGYKCAEPGYPGVYTRVTHYMSWLETNMKHY